MSDTALREAEVALSRVRAEHKEVSEKLAAQERRVLEARASLHALISLPPLRKRSLVSAYALWLLCPFIWPGAYLFYLGRDTHALLYSSTFGGFGLGWLVDAFYIPLYVRDYNEAPGCLEHAEARLKQRYSLMGLLLAPFTLSIQLLIGIYFGTIGAYLVPRPIDLPKWLHTHVQPLGVPSSLSRTASARVGFIFGMVALAAAIKMASLRIGRTRVVSRWRPVLSWTALGAALFMPSSLTADAEEVPDELQHLPGLIVGAAGVMIGAASGRTFAPIASPRRATARSLSLRMLVQVAGCVAVLGAGVGAFYLNGSYTHKDAATGLRTTYTGPEALHLAYESLGSFSTDLRAALSSLYERHKHQSWSELWEEVRAAFRDPAVEAAQVLGVATDASADEVRKAHRQLARVHHPDKISGLEPDRQEEAKHAMQRLNWAKELLLADPADRKHEKF